MAGSTSSVAGRYWSAHTHSRHSVDDAMSPVPELASEAVRLGYPALGITDHGNMAHVVALYQAGVKLGLPVAPGCEMYLTSVHELRDKRSMHLTMLAYTGEGYRNLVALHNQAHRQFYRRPRLDFADLAYAAEAGRTAGIAIGTGCRSGPVVRALTERDDQAAAQVVNALAGWFPRVYVELMDHGFSADGFSDTEIYNTLVGIAEQVGLPTILTGDAHYTYENERKLHDALKVLVSFSPDPEEGKFSGSGYWLRSHEEMDPWQHGFEGLDDLAAAIKVKIPELDTFALKIPDVTFGKDANQVLAAATLSAQTEIPNKSKPDVRTRTLDELKVIKETEMAPYLNLVKMITDFMEEEGIWYYARGSVAGSRVCYDLGISATDPLYWQIRMERFLSGDRTSPPDIDLDIEHERRGEVIAMLERQGYELVQVGTQPTYGLDAEEDEEEGEGRGSLRVKYYGTLAKQGLPRVPWVEVEPADKKTLYELARNARPPQERLISGVGAHPGGYVVAANKQVVACLPIVQISSSGTFVTALRKDEVEIMGFPKIDMLGSKVLTAVKKACMMITGKDAKEAKEFWRSIPLDDKEAMKRAASGNTTGLFQLGGWAQRKGLQDLKPRKTADIVAAQALFRPAPLNSGFTDEYMARRRKDHPVPPMHADIADETKDTYGIALYQEQVVGILRRIGVQPKQLTQLLKAVKASGKADTETAKGIIAGAMEAVLDLARARDWNEDDLSYLERALLDYGAGYSFGKAHSVTYGVVAYNTSYLAAHHPLAYWYGMLNAYMGSKNSKGDSLEPIYRKAASTDGIKIRSAHVNTSELGYTADEATNSIRLGLISVPNVGKACAEELVAKRPFASVIDLASRVNGKVSGAKMVLTSQNPDEAFWAEIDELDENNKPTGHKVVQELTHAMAQLFHHHALEAVPFGDPIRRAKGRKRKCAECRVTFPTPLEYEDHLEEVRHDENPE